jgi:uncharacterized protein (DUF1800 family)
MPEGTMPEASHRSVSRIDPAEAWQPWRPADRQPWSLKWAGHLYRRAGFGATWDELQEAVARGPDATLEGLLSGGPGLEQFDEEVDAVTKGLPLVLRGTTLHEYQGVWLYRMMNTPHPLRERMTLFWHNHFATSVAKVRQPGLMQRQNNLLRRHALGDFRALLLEVSRDPAMLIWLDSNSNVRGHANENFARELMELFALGIGNYTEKDVQAAARAFTGWHTAGGKFIDNRRQHDPGVKTVLGHTGPLDGQDVIAILLEQPAAARFLVGKLYRHFIAEDAPPSAQLLEPLADQFRKSGYDIAGVVGTMLRSRLFFSEHAYRRRIKSPVEFVVGLARTLGGKAAPGELANLLDGLGQDLYSPPNVKGWDGGKAWLNSATMLARQNASWALVGGEDLRFRDKIKLAELARRKAGSEAAKQVGFVVNLFLQGDVTPAVSGKLLSTLIGNKGQKSDPSRRIVEAAHTVLLMPEYQLA